MTKLKNMDKFYVPTWLVFADLVTYKHLPGVHVNLCVDWLQLSGHWLL